MADGPTSTHFSFSMDDRAVALQGGQALFFVGEPSSSTTSSSGSVVSVERSPGTATDTLGRRLFRVRAQWSGDAFFDTTDLVGLDHGYHTIGVFYASQKAGCAHYVTGATDTSGHCLGIMVDGQVFLRGIDSTWKCDCASPSAWWATAPSVVSCSATRPNAVDRAGTCVADASPLFSFKGVIGEMQLAHWTAHQYAACETASVHAPGDCPWAAAGTRPMSLPSSTHQPTYASNTDTGGWYGSSLLNYVVPARAVIVDRALGRTGPSRQHRVLKDSPPFSFVGFGQRMSFSPIDGAPMQVSGATMTGTSVDTVDECKALRALQTARASASTTEVAPSAQWTAAGPTRRRWAAAWKTRWDPQSPVAGCTRSRWTSRT